MQHNSKALKMAVYALCISLLSACSLSEEPDPQQALDVASGATIAELSGYWVANPCTGGNVTIGFASDGNCKAKTGQNFHNCTWKSTSEKSITITYTPNCPLCMTSITNLSGGISNGSLTGKGFRSDGYSPTNCTFALNGGTL